MYELPKFFDDNGVEIGEYEAKTADIIEKIISIGNIVDIETLVSTKNGIETSLTKKKYTVSFLGKSIEMISIFPSDGTDNTQSITIELFDKGQSIGKINYLEDSNDIDVKLVEEIEISGKQSIDDSTEPGDIMELIDGKTELGNIIDMMDSILFNPVSLEISTVLQQTT